MTILAFDLSLSCTGYSVFSNDGMFIETGHIETNGKDSTPRRLKVIAQRLRKLKTKYKPSKVLIERGFYRFAGSTEQIFRVNGITNLIFCEIEQIELHATSIRKIVAGRGNMKKEELRDYILQKYPSIEFANMDEIDSFALGLAYFLKEGVLNGRES